MELRRLIGIVRAWLPLMVVTALLAGAAAFVVSNFQQKTYESKATLIVGQALSAANPDYTQLLVAQSLAATYAAVAETRPILDSLITDLKLTDAPADLAGRIQVEAPRDSTLLIITAQDADPAQAAAIANGLAQQLIKASPTIRGQEAEFLKSIDADLKATQALIDSTQSRYEALSAIDKRTAAQEAEWQALEGQLVNLRSTYAALLSFSSASTSNLLTVVEPAEPSTSPVAPRTLLNTLLAAALGLLVVAAIAFVAEQLDDSIKDAEAIEEVAHLATLGSITKMSGDRGRQEMYRLAAFLYPRSGAAEAFRALRANVEFAAVDAPVRTLLVSSAIPGEGKTVMASNLAIVFAQSGRKVILVDADLRKPGVHKLFNLPNAEGLTSMLRSDAIDLQAASHETEEAYLRVLTTGPLPPNPAELLGSQRMRTVLATLQKSADLVILDSPPLEAVADASVMSSFVDGTILVVDAGRSRRRSVRRARELLERAGARVLGAVLNRAAATSPSSYTGYYGEADDPGKAPTRRPVTQPGSTERPEPAATRPG